MSDHVDTLALVEQAQKLDRMIQSGYEIVERDLGAVDLTHNDLGEVFLQLDYVCDWFVQVLEIDLALDAYWAEGDLL